MNQSELNRAPDELLLKEFKKSSDNRVIGELYERYVHLVYAVCMKYLKNPEDSKDAVMQIFEFLIAELNNQEVRNFKSWLYTVAKNQCLMQIRREKSRQKVLNGVSEKSDEEFMEFYDILHLNNEEEVAGTYLLVLKAMSKLNEEQRRCIELKYLEDKSYEEVAVITGFSLNQVKSHIQNGKRNLMNIIRRERQ